MPSHFSQPLQDFVKALLVKVPNRRLGCTQGGVAQVKAHPWFNGFDWDALARRELKAPYVPEVKGADDASNFEGMGHAEEQSRGRYVSIGVFKDF
jgi:hypothetical protein